jgi:hemerythrin
VSTLRSVVDLASGKSTAFGTERGVSSARNVFKMRHELIDAQVEVLRMYMEKKSAERLLEALDRLVECTRASFREEEELMELFGSAPDTGHRDLHNSVLAQLDSLRRCVMDFDRGRLLAQLILVDRQLTSHISDAMQAPVRQRRECLVESEAVAAAIAESLAHH